MKFKVGFALGAVGTVVGIAVYFHPYIDWRAIGIRLFSDPEES